MFEKDAKEYCNNLIQNEIKVKSIYDIEVLQKDLEKLFQYVAEFGYNKANEELEEKYKETLCNLEMNLNSVTERLEELEKANEWQYVSEKGTPQKEGHYLVCLRNKDRDILDCWIYYDKDVGWYSYEIRFADIYAWKEFVLPSLDKEKADDTEQRSKGNL